MEDSEPIEICHMALNGDSTCKNITCSQDQFPHC